MLCDVDEKDYVGLNCVLLTCLSFSHNARRCSELIEAS